MALLSAVLLCAAIPSLTISSIISLLVFIGSTAFVSYLMYKNFEFVPRAIKVVHVGVLLVLIGVLVDALTTIFTGESAGYGIDNVASVLGFVVISYGMIQIALARDAVSSRGDILDAVASTVVPAVIAFSILIPAAMDNPSTVERVDALVFMATNMVLFGVMFLLVYGAGYRSTGTSWSAAAGFFATTLTWLALIGDASGASWRPDLARLFGFGFVLYLIAISDPSLATFASPGTRKQTYRWVLYIGATGALGVWSAFNFDSVTAVGAAVLAVVTIARLRISQITNQRLTKISAVHSILATNLSVSNTVDEALEAGRLACMELIDERHNVSITTDASKGDHIDFLPEDTNKVIFSEAGTTLIHSEGRLQSFEVVAFEQIATVVDFAVGSVELRAQEAARIAQEDWFEAAKHDANTGLLNMTDFRSLDLISADLMVAFYFPDVSRATGTESVDAAEELMNLFATRLWGLVRDEDVLWRGDGATLILAIKKMEGEPAKWVEAKREKLAREVDHDGRNFMPTVTASVLRLEHPIKPASALVRLDMAARYASELSVFSPTIVFTPEIEAQVSRQWKIESAFASALRDPEESGFEVHYQPIINSRSKQVEGLEALARWKHAELGNISPAEFIPAAERAGLVSAVDSYVLNTALRDMEMLQAANAKLHIQVNMSPVSLTPERIREAANTVLLQRGKGTESGIVFELIESALGAHEINEMKEAMDYCRDIGIGLALDDFGSGESNFDRLAKLPFTQIKLANEFAQSGDSLLIESMLRTVSDLGMESVVEGVETQDQFEMVVAAGARRIQGWYFAKAKPLDETFDFLLERRVAESKRKGADSVEA